MLTLATRPMTSFHSPSTPLQALLFSFVIPTAPISSDFNPAILVVGCETLTPAIAPSCLAAVNLTEGVEPVSKRRIKRSNLAIRLLEEAIIEHVHRITYLVPPDIVYKRENAVEITRRVFFLIGEVKKQQTKKCCSSTNKK